MEIEEQNNSGISFRPSDLYQEFSAIAFEDEADFSEGIKFEDVLNHSL
jgi:hypothetical protein